MIFKPLRELTSTTCPPAGRVALCGILGLSLMAQPLQAGEGVRTSGLAEREVARRQAIIAQADALIQQGGAAEQQSDYVEGMKDYRQAYSLLPDAPMTAPTKKVARDGYSRCANAQARKLAKDARYNESRQLLATVLDPSFDPDNAPAKLLLKQLDDPVRYEPALSPEHLKKVGDVTTLLSEGESLRRLGDYDGSLAKFMDALRIDPYNTAARRGMEKVEHEKSVYFDSARDHRRSKMLNEVNAGWEDPVPVMDVSGLFGPGQSTTNALVSGPESILEHLRTWIVPMIDLQKASLDEVVEFMRIRSRDLDPKKRGINFVLRVGADTKNKDVTLNLAQVPLEEVLRYVTQMTGTAYHVDQTAVTITSLTEATTTLIQRSYRVPPGFLSNAPVDAASAAPAAPPNPFDKTAPAPGLQGLSLHRLTAREFLEQRGVGFPEGASANFTPGTSMLIVRNTVENLATVEALVEQASTSAPKQVEIRVRMIDVDQTNYDELGFDWLLGQSNLPGSSGVFTSGGTVATSSTTSAAGSDYGIGYPGTTTPVGQYSVTSGLRSGGAILGQPSIDALIHSGQTPSIDSKSPGAFTIAGVFTDPQFQLVIRALSQKKGVDLMTSPSVVTKSGQRATIVIARELPYPTEFNPPQIPTQVGNNTVTTAGAGGVPNTRGSSSFAPITPTTPTAFAKRDVGVTMEVEPVVDGNNRIVHLNVVPSSTEFEGFVDYGSPITNGAPIGFGGATVFYQQPNHILQPIFRTNKSSTAVDIWDGNTIAMAGVITESRTDINDKVPILGSLPIIGRAFQSHVSQVERKNVAFFVSVRIIDPAGNNINQILPSAAPAPIPAAGGPAPATASAP